MSSIVFIFCVGIIFGPITYFQILYSAAEMVSNCTKLLCLSWFAATCFQLTTASEVLTIQSDDKVPICFLPTCEDTHTQSPVLKHCDKSYGMYLRGRCCKLVADNLTIVYVDLSSCNLTSIGKMLAEQAPKVKKIDLADNQHLKTDADTFHGLTKLNLLMLPPHLQCPGHHDWFNESWTAWNSTKQYPLSITCRNQTDTCHLLEQHNYTCPQHSFCRNDGPGAFKCICDKGWTGYKCLRLSHKNPDIAIICGTLGSAIVLSAFFWYTQRRLVINS